MSALLTLKAVIVRFPTSSGQFRKRDKLGGFVFFVVFLFFCLRGEKKEILMRERLSTENRTSNVLYKKYKNVIRQ